MIRVGLVAIVLAVIALAAVRLYAPSRSDTAQRLSTPAGSDYYLLDSEVRQMNEQGRLRYRIRSSRSLHFPDDSAKLSKLDVTYIGKERGRWQLTAPHGKVPPGSRDIRLSGGVVLTHTATENPLRVTTPYVWVRSKRDRADTKAAVRATGQDERIKGTGMTVYLDGNRLTLHHDVQVDYAP